MANMVHLKNLHPILLTDSVGISYNVHSPPLLPPRCTASRSSLSAADLKSDMRPTEIEREGGGEFLCVLSSEPFLNLLDDDLPRIAYLISLTPSITVFLLVMG